MDTDQFRRALFSIFSETFEKVQGMYLDGGTFLFETLATISAEEASRPVGGRCATLAAQVRHVTFYLDVLEKAVRTQQFERQDWGLIWRETTQVTGPEWEALTIALRESYERLKQLAADTAWETENEIAGAFAVVAHTAYHLGEIRQALCCLRS